MMAVKKPSARIRQAAEKVGAVDVSEPMTSEQIDDFAKLQDIRERLKHHRTIVSAWKQQQEQDRKLRKLYANWLMCAMSAQVIAINIIFVLIGCGILKYEQWTANTFVMATFAEISALVLLVVKYLFPAGTEKVRDLIDQFKAK